MRYYAAYYDSSIGKWKVIYQYSGNGDYAWYDHIPDAGSEESAKSTVDALNAQARKFD